MTGGRPWKPRDCGCTNASPPWPPAWTGWPKKGAAARTAKPPEAAEDGLAGHGSAVAGAAGGVRVGVAGSPHPGGQRARHRGRGTTTVGRAAGSDAAAPRRGWLARRGGEPLPEGVAELLAGAVPLLRSAGLTADEQRPGAFLW